MRFTLEVIRGRKGDCLLLHLGSTQDPHLLLIDGGPSGVYESHLRPRLVDIREERGLSDDESLFLDLVMVSHVDDDHINGILDLTGELIEATNERRAQLVQVFALWHNSFDNIIGNDPAKLLSAVDSVTASTGVDMPEDIEIDPDDSGVTQKDVQASLRVLSSIRQGAQLCRDAERLDWSTNPHFDDRLIVASAGQDDIEIADTKFTVVGPLKAEVQALQREHDKWLRQLEREGKTPEEILSAYVDNSVPNLSSLVFVVEHDGKRILLTGDARGDKILEGLVLKGFLQDSDDSTAHFDILKIPHHGSEHNVDVDFFHRVTADHYVFSGDGEHGNPERKTFEMLFEARGDAPFQIHLTYPVDEIDHERELDWIKQQAKEIRKKRTKPSQVVREDWSHNKHSLAKLFESQAEMADRIHVVFSGTPHTIHLGDACHS